LITQPPRTTITAQKTKTYVTLQLHTQNTTI